MHPTSKTLAEKLRPQQLNNLVGQKQLFQKGSLFYRFLLAEKNNSPPPRLPSILFWGPAGCGKTTLARLLAKASRYHVELLSAVFASISQIKKIFADAEKKLAQNPPLQTCLFLDELHRFNKAQQDGLLGAVENGLVTLLGATTENPSFEINTPLLSRLQVVTLTALNKQDLLQLLAKAETYLNSKLLLTENAKIYLATLADGDGRRLLNLIETINVLQLETILDEKELSEVLQERFFMHDKHGESHFNLISALHKSLRGSDPNAALYWFSRMLLGGESVHYLARRLLRFAYEDVGLADPQAATRVLTAWQTYERIGSPEGDIALAQATLYLAVAPKSNRVYAALNAANQFAAKYPSLPPPKHILNAPTEFMKKIGYAKGYRYDPDTKYGFSGQNYFPDTIPPENFYRPIERGFEREIIKRMHYFEKLREKLAAEKS